MKKSRKYSYYVSIFLCVYLMIQEQIFEMSVNQFSADRDHETMTWGTLDPVKVVKVLQDAYALNVYHIIMSPYQADEVFHRGSHTLEHYLAYSGGIRDQLKVLSQAQGIELDSKSLLDISPEKRGDKYAIKISSLIDFGDGAMLLQAAKNALEIIQPQLADASDIPFANARQCGQYTYHGKAAALDMVQKAQLSLEIEKKDFSGKPYINVCDFRQLKPKMNEGTPDAPTYFLDPDVSHTLGNYVDAHWAELGMSDVCVSTGVYGCMTGQYVIIASEKEIDRAVLDRVHGGLMKLMMQCARENTAWERMQQDVEQMVNLVEKYNAHIL